MNAFCYIKVSYKGLLLVLLPLIFGLVFTVILARQLAATVNDFEKLQKSQQVMLGLNEVGTIILKEGVLVNSFQEVTPEQRRRSFAKGKALYMQPGYFGSVKLDPNSEFKELFADAETSRQMFLGIIKEQEAGAAYGPNKTFTNKDRERVIMCLLTFNSLLDRIKATTVKLDNEEPAEISRLFTALVVSLIIGIAASCGLSLLIAYIFTFDIVKRLRKISDNAILVAAGKDLPMPMAGTDEIAKLDATLHEAGEQLKNLQRKELAILNNAADVVTSLDRRLRFLAIGESAHRIWGYPVDDLIGRSLVSILEGATNSDVVAEFETIAKSGINSDVMTVILCKDGTLKDSSWTVNWSGDAQEFVCVVHDVTQLKRIEKLKQAFFSMVSHDLRTPLASMNVNIANLTSGLCGPVPEGGEKLLNNAASNIVRLTALVNDLLDLDKLDSDRLTLDIECISLRDVCEASIQSLESMASNAGIVLAPPSGDAAVMADERRLVQVVTNLISNAIKYSPRGEKVTIEIRRRGKMVEVAVSDKGPGVPLDLQQTLFDKYKQGDAVASVGLKGTGLGLAIVKSIVKAHDGIVGIDSEPGSGSTFWIRLKEFTDDGGGP